VSGVLASPFALVTSVGAAIGSRAAAAALACVDSKVDCGLLIDLHRDRAPRSTLLATAGARGLEERIVSHMPEADVASRGRLCHLRLSPDARGLEGVLAALPLARGLPTVIHLPPALLPPTLGESRVRPSAALLRADLHMSRSLTALAARDLIEREIRVAVLKRPLGWVAARRALLGAPPLFGGGLPPRLVGRLLKPVPPAMAGLPK
jgi:hypothetical protein